MTNVRLTVLSWQTGSGLHDVRVCEANGLQPPRQNYYRLDLGLVRVPHYAVRSAESIWAYPIQIQAIVWPLNSLQHGVVEGHGTVELLDLHQLNWRRIRAGVPSCLCVG